MKRKADERETPWNALVRVGALGSRQLGRANEMSWQEVALIEEMVGTPLGVAASRVIGSLGNGGVYERPRFLN